MNHDTDAQAEHTADSASARDMTRDEILDNLPEAVAMRRAREARAEAQAAREAKPEGRRETRRKLLVGAILGLGTAARMLGRSRRPQRPR